MNGPVRVAAAAAVAICVATGVRAQIVSQPEAEPSITAQLAPWYVSGEPVSFAGHLYYPAGPRVFFSGNEMVLSGWFRGVPLYTRTTIEPYSKVFVPIGGGLMQPYERPRTGDLAGTAGSSVPSFPVDLASAGPETIDESRLEAPAPPTFVKLPIAPPAPAFEGTAPAPSAVGTTGLSPRHTSRRLPAPGRGIADVYVEYGSTRYYSSGSPTLLGRGRYERVGEYHGLPVYVRGADRRTIFIPVQRGSDLLARYTVRRPR